VCRGCKRFTHEVINWNAYSEVQKRIIDERLSGFLSQCVSNSLSVNDPTLLRWQLEVQQIAYVPHHDERCWLYSLLKAGSKQIDKPADYGFEVQALFRDMSLSALRDTIDDEFYALSQAHYDCYMLTPDFFGERDQ